MKKIILVLSLVGFAFSAQANGNRIKQLAKDINKQIQSHSNYNNLTRSERRVLRGSLLDIKDLLDDLRIGGRAKIGFFCQGSSIYDKSVNKVIDLNFSSNCKAAIQQIKKYDGNFCKGSVLRNIYDGRIADLNFSSNCVEGLEQIERYNGHFCAGSVLHSVERGRIKDFNFSSNCKNVLDQFAN